MTAVIAPNVGEWDGEMPQRPIPAEGYGPDPGTGSLYNSQIALADSDTIYTDVAATPAQAPAVVTLPSLVDAHDHPLGLHGAAGNALPFIV